MRRSYLVSGAVQGVGFRHYAWRQGQRIGVTGWVSNLPDGRVEAAAEGTAEQLEEFERALRQGPPSASVTYLHIVDSLDEAQRLITFEIR